MQDKEILHFIAWHYKVQVAVVSITLDSVHSFMRDLDFQDMDLQDLDL